MNFIAGWLTATTHWEGDFLARYRKILTSTWSDDKFKKLSAPKPNGQTLFMYLLAGPHTTNIPGLSSAGSLELAERLGWPPKAFRRCFGEIEAQGMANADWTAPVIWLPNGIKHNPPESPNAIRAWVPTWSDIPESTLRLEALRKLSEFIRTMPEGFIQAFADGFGEVLHNTFGEVLLEGYTKGSGKGSRKDSSNISRSRSAIVHGSPTVRASEGLLEGLPPTLAESGAGAGVKAFASEQSQKTGLSSATNSNQKPLLSHPEAPEPTTYLDVTIPLTDGSDYKIPLSEFEEFKRLYPGVDVLQEIREMRGWSLKNPRKRKTRRGVGAFMNSWLAAEQDKASRRSDLPPSGQRASQDDLRRQRNQEAVEKFLNHDVSEKQ